jgi:hypothetical protein
MIPFPLADGLCYTITVSLPCHTGLSNLKGDGHFPTTGVVYLIEE